MDEAARIAGGLDATLRSGDHVVWGQATAEPTPLTEAIVARQDRWAPLSVFVGAAFTSTLSPGRVEGMRIASYGAIGTTRTLAAAGLLDIVPCNISRLSGAIARGEIGCDVAVVQLSPPGPNGRPSLGPINDYIRAALKRARVVVAEVNARAPWTFGPEPEGLDKIGFTLETDRALVEAPAKLPTAVERAIGRHAASVIGDGATLQTGIGGAIDALLESLADRRDLGVHSGMIGDGMLALIEGGAVTNARKAVDRGVTVTGGLYGGERLMRFAHCNRAVEVQPYDYTHDAAVLARLPNLVTVNSAIEVDLTGQVNAETAEGRYIGGIGGQLDFSHMGARAPEGCAIIALPSTAAGGKVSRIRLSVDTVTCPRSNVDVVVTEHGCADLRGLTLRRRIRRMLEIAHPDFREELERGAHALLARGF